MTGPGRTSRRAARTGRSSTTGGRSTLALRLDDRTLNAPYVIDPIAVVGTPTTGSTKTGTPLSIATPAGVVSGNLELLTFALRDTTATVTTTGWTLISSVLSPNATASSRTRQSV